MIKHQGKCTLYTPEIDEISKEVLFIHLIFITEWTRI
jgi:hypothetical protein